MATVQVHPEGWKPAKGYSNGMTAEGKLLFVGGQIGWNREQKFESHDFIGQMSQALRNVLDVVEAAGGDASNIVRLTWYVTSKQDYLALQRQVGEAYRKIMGYHFPVMTMVVVAGLIEDQALLEIEATAVL